MNKQEIIKAYRDAGFTVEELLDDITVSLNRFITLQEIMTVCDEIEEHQVMRFSDNEVGIYLPYNIYGSEYEV